MEKSYSKYLIFVTKLLCINKSTFVLPTRLLKNRGQSQVGYSCFVNGPEMGNRKDGEYWEDVDSMENRSEEEEQTGELESN